MDRRLIRCVRHAEIEHLASKPVYFRMGGEWRDLINRSGEREPADCVQRFWIELPRKPLLAERKQTFPVHIHADVRGRFECNPTYHPIVRKGRSESTEHRPACCRF